VGPVQPVQPVKPKAKPVSTKGFTDDLPGTISIKSPAKQEANGAESDAEQLHNSAASAFTEDELKTHWRAFAAGLQTDFPHLATTLSSSDPILKEGWGIEFEVDNRILEEELNQKRGELLEFLKRTLDNYQITLQTRIQENHIELKPYTDKEKFEKMAAKNPALNKLKEQLDLDIEY